MGNCGACQQVSQGFPGSQLYESLSKPASCQSGGSSTLLLHVSGTGGLGICSEDAGGGRLWSWGSLAALPAAGASLAGACVSLQIKRESKGGRM